MKLDSIQTTIDKLEPEGFGLSYAQPVNPSDATKKLAIWNALPGEVVKAGFYKKRKGILYGHAFEILKASKVRVEAQEAHFLSCSPWQIMDYSYEAAAKCAIAEEFFRAQGIEISALKIEQSEQSFGYRNKMEYSFTVNESGELSFAFFQRSGRRKIPIEVCMLADINLNAHALKILNILKENKIAEQMLKSLVVRSNSQGHTLAALFVKDKTISANIFDTIANTLVYYSEPLSPASVATELLYRNGSGSIEEEIFARTLRFGATSFFQANFELFKKSVTAMMPYVSGHDIVDLYCGVGSIAIALGDIVKTARLVDIDKSAIDLAHDNIILNKLDHIFSAVASPAEKLLNEITSDKVIIIDPSRPGLHHKVIERFLEVKPKRIIYLACNVATQARDVAQLLESYTIKHSELFNFFPRTPHIESLVVLELRN